MCGTAGTPTLLTSMGRELGAAPALSVTPPREAERSSSFRKILLKNSHRRPKEFCSQEIQIIGFPCSPSCSRGISYQQTPNLWDTGTETGIPRRNLSVPRPQPPSHTAGSYSKIPKAEDEQGSPEMGSYTISFAISAWAAQQKTSWGDIIKRDTKAIPGHPGNALQLP